MYRYFFKRVFDFMIVLMILLVIWPILLVITVWLHWANKEAGAFFTQERPGKDGKIFKVIKFKSMTDERDENGDLLPDAQRLTKVGRFVRSISLDELPQLINVLKGDMALIGPRPLLPQYLSLFSVEQARRHEVRPGITGWAQVQGRNLCKFSKKFEYDVWYVDHVSFWLDLKIFWMTFLKVIRRSDVGEGGGNMKEVDDLHFVDRLKGYAREFGSDYNFCTNVKTDRAKSLLVIYPDSSFFATGRNALEGIIKLMGYKRVWMPCYFCYDVIASIEKLGVEIVFYNDFPANKNDNDVISKLSFKDGDVLLRMNYFGCRGWRDNSHLRVPVIEDHSHDPVSDWALNSNADWCFASLRKTLPIACGAMVWSPKKLNLPRAIQTSACESMARARYEAMRLKDDYLKYGDVNKANFRKLYLATEKLIDTMPCSAIDKVSMEIISRLDIHEWTRQRRVNYNVCRDLLKGQFEVLEPEREFDMHPFSLVLLTRDNQERESLRQKLIGANVYPAILWSIPDDTDKGINTSVERDFSTRMLSVHCDARYTERNMEVLCNIIKDMV